MVSQGSNSYLAEITTSESLSTSSAAEWPLYMSAIMLNICKNWMRLTQMTTILIEIGFSHHKYNLQ